MRRRIVVLMVLFTLLASLTALAQDVRVSLAPTRLDMVRLGLTEQSLSGLPGETLQCLAGNVTDPDGDTVTFNFRWTVDRGGEMLTLRDVSGIVATQQTDGTWDSTDLLPEGLTEDGDVVMAQVSATDSEGATGQPTTGSLPIRALGTMVPHAAEPLVATAIGSDDDPGDVLTFDFTWAKLDADGVTWVDQQQSLDVVGVAGADGRFTATDTLPADTTAKNETWRCTVIADDGEYMSEPLSDQVVVRGRAPKLDSIIVEPVR